MCSFCVCMATGFSLRSHLCSLHSVLSLCSTLNLPVEISICESSPSYGSDSQGITVA